MKFLSTIFAIVGFILILTAGALVLKFGLDNPMDFIILGLTSILIATIFKVMDELKKGK